MKILSFKSLNKKRKKGKKEKINVPSEYRTRHAGIADTTILGTQPLLGVVNLQNAEDMNMVVFFLAKCVWASAKPMVVDRKNQKALALLYLASGPWPNATISSVVPTEFAAAPGNKDEFLESKFLYLNFLPSTKKTTEYSFDPFLSIYRYLKFFLNS